MEHNMKVIAHIRSDFTSKFAIPRQSGILSELESKIEFEPSFSSPDYIRGIENFSHLWLIWCFSENLGKETGSTVRPPRLGGNQRVGVFATRSPFRPNPIGISSVRLVRVEEGKRGKVLVVSGADLMDGTPIYDIKPYLAFSDSHPEAVAGFADLHREDALKVNCSEEMLSCLPLQKQSAFITILSQDPRPSYQNDPDRIYGFSFAGFEISFSVKEDVLTVLNIEKIPNR